MSFFELIAQGDAVSRLVALLLVGMSVASWVVILWKVWLLPRARRELTNGRAAGDVQRAGELAIVSRNHGFDEHVAHATGGTGHSHLMKGVRVHVDRGRRGRRIIPAADRHRG